MTILGTSHFVSIGHAAKYYAAYGFDFGDVMNKFLEEEISIGEPNIKKGETLKVIEGRYHIVSN